MGVVLIGAAIVGGAAQAETQRTPLHPPAAPLTTPAPSPHSQEAAASDPRGTDQMPLAVRIVPTPKSEAEAAQEQQDRDQRADNQSWLVALTRTLAAATGGLVIATIGLWFTAAWQARTLKAAVDTARRSAESTEFVVKTMEAVAERQQRAYVFVKEVVVETERTDPRLRRIVRVAFENTGATATRHLIASVNWGQFQPDIPPDFHFPDGSQSPALLGPRQSMDIRAVDIPAEAFVNAAQGSHKLYVWGFAEYNDVFANTARHRTEFCFRLLVQGDPANEPCRFDASLHDKYNAADDDCSKKPSRHLI